jgi:sulfonate transport system substrate-binding protein
VTRFQISLYFVCVLLSVVPGPDLKIAVNSTTIESFPVFAAAEALSTQIQLVRTPSGRNAMAQLLNGEVDAATGSETQALLNSVADPRIRIILTLAECRYRIIARRSAGIRKMSDLRGKKVAATLNTSSQYYLSGMLRGAQLKESDIELVALEGQDMPAALQDHNVDAVSIWEPHAQNSFEALGDDAIVLEDPAVYIERFNLNTRTDVLRDPAKRLALRRFLEAIARVSVRLRTQPADMIPSLAPNVGLSERTIASVWSQFKFPASLSGELRAVLGEIEPWVAATQTRRPRTNRTLVTLIDASLLAEAQK